MGNPNILVNLVSRRVRQLTTGGSGARPLISDTAGLGAGDIAMIEILEGKMGWEMVSPIIEAETPVKKKRKS